MHGLTYITVLFSQNYSLGQMRWPTVRVHSTEAHIYFPHRLPATHCRFTPNEAR